MSAWRSSTTAKFRHCTSQTLPQDKTIFSITLSSHSTFSTSSSSWASLCYLNSSRPHLHCSLHSQIYRTYTTRVAPSPALRRNARQGKNKPIRVSRLSARTYNRHEKPADWKHFSRSTTSQLQLQQFQLILPEEIKNGRIECNLATAWKLMAIGSTLKVEPNASVIGDICRDHDVPIRVVSQIASLLVKTSTTELHKSGKRLLRGTANAGDPYAILFICGNAVHHDRLNSASFLSLRGKLDHLAQHDNIPQAVYLTGRIAQRNGKRKEAAELFKRCLSLLSMTAKITKDHGLSASEKELEAYERAIHNSGTMPHPSVYLTNFCLEDGDLNGALDACKLGALKHDVPEAYFLLAINLRGRFEPHNFDRWLQYFIKAATSGLSHASHKLGIHYATSASTPPAEKLTLKNLDPDFYHMSSLNKNKKSNSTENNHQKVEARLPASRKSVSAQPQPTTTTTKSTPPSPPPTPMSPSKSTHPQRKHLLLAKHWLGIAVAQDHLVSNLALARVLWELGDKRTAMNILEEKLVGSVDAVRVCPLAMKAARELLPKWEKEVSGSGGAAASAAAADDDSGMMSRIRSLWRV